MPSALLRPCPGDGGRCPALVTKGRCPVHAKQQDRRRGTDTARGYGSKWRRYASSFKREFPLCGDRPSEAPAATDSECRARGLIVAAYVVDHIKPVTGPDDPSFYDRSNHQALCERCHNVKRQTERGRVA